MGVVGNLPNVTEVGHLGADVGVVRRLSVRGIPTYLDRVYAPDGRPHLIVVERVARGAEIGDERAAEWVREARIAAELDHENVLRARAIVVRQGEIRIACDLVDGERLSELLPVPLEIALRILIDVLTGLAAVHKLKDAGGQHRVKLVHGEVTPSNVLVGLDGVSRLLRTCRVREPRRLPIEGVGFLAPEILTNAHVDPRADVFSAGALLWQALSGEPFVEGEASIESILDLARCGIPSRRCRATRRGPWSSQPSRRARSSSRPSGASRPRRPW